MKAFGKRFCTYCGRVTMKYYEDYDGDVYGECSCGNIDWCDNETKQDVIKKWGNKLIPIKS